MSTATKNDNIIKTRDDHEPVHFQTVVGQNSKFILAAGQQCSWVKPGKSFNLTDLRKRIEPWLTTLVQSEHLSLLLGSGLTYAVKELANPGAGTPETSRMETATWDNYNEILVKAAEESAKAADRPDNNFEDDIRVANELLRGLEILINAGAAFNLTTDNVTSLRDEITGKLKNFAASILSDEIAIATADESPREQAFNILIAFLMSFASRIGTRDRLNIFTTNYDRIIETGSELAGLHLLDRFVGNITPLMRSTRMDLDLHYNPPGIRGEPRYLEGVARFTKLHGSIDWVQIGRDIRRIGLPFGASDITPYINIPGHRATENELIIYPNSAKDRETAAYPYVELFRDLAAAICRPNSTIFTYGYSFGDEHINRVIEDMLTIPSTHLVIISMDDSSERIMKMYERVGKPSQISLLIGPVLAKFKQLTNSFLPKASIDRATFRMNEILIKRVGPSGDSEKKPNQGEDVT